MDVSTLAPTPKAIPTSRTGSSRTVDFNDDNDGSNDNDDNDDSDVPMGESKPPPAKGLRIVEKEKKQKKKENKSTEAASRKMRLSALVKDMAFDVNKSSEYALFKDRLSKAGPAV